MDSEQLHLKKKYNELFSEVEEILFRHDPISINFETNTDEYSREVGTILPRLKNAKSKSDVYEILTEEFSEWFNIPITRLQDDLIFKTIAQEVWDSWKRFQNDRPR